MKKETTAAAIRQKAEELLKLRTDARPCVSSNENDLLKLIHELQVHQIELEMQNEELLAAKQKIEELAKEKYKELYDFAPSGYLSLTKDGKITELNFAAAKMLGKERLDLINSLFGFFVSAETKPAFNHFLEEAFKSNTKETCEVALTANGDIPIIVSLTGAHNESGDRCLVTVLDITERNNAVVSLKESEERFQQLFNIAPLGYQSLDFDGNFIEVNQKWLDMLGYTREEVIGKWFGNFLTAAYQSGFREQFPIFKAQGHIHSEFEMVHKNGSVFFIAFEGKIGYDKSGEFKQTHCILQDITELRKAGVALKESEKLFKEVFEASNVGKSITLISGEINVNQAYCNILGYSEVELKNKKWQDLTPPEDIPGIMKIVTALLDGEIDQARFNKRYLHKNGNKILADVSVALVRDEQGNPLHFITTVIDITERRQAEEALRASEERYALVLDASEQGIWDWNLETNEVFYSEQWKRHIGYKDNELKNDFNTWIEHLHPDEREYCQNAVSVYLNQPVEHFLLEFRFRHKDGSYRWIYNKASSLKNNEGKVIRMFGTHTDFTERKQAGEALRKSEENLSITLNSIGDGVISTDIDGLIASMNPVAEKLCGWELTDALGKPLTEVFKIINAETRQYVADPVEKVLGNGEIVGLANHTLLISKNGTEYQIADSAAPIKNKDGEISGVVLVFSDVSEKYAAEEALKESEEKFRIAQEMSPDGFTILHPVRNEKGEAVDFTWVYQNQAIARLNGTVPNEVIGKRLLELFPTHSGTPVFEAYLHVANTRKTQILDEVYAGEIVSLPTWLRIVIVSMGEDIAILAQDITGRKQSEQLIKQASEHWIKTFDAIQDGIAILDSEQNVVQQNEAFQKIVERSSSSKHGNHCFHLVHNTECPIENCPFVRAKISNKREMMELVIGESVFEVVVDPFVNENQEIVGAVHIMKDITERKLAEERLRESEERYKSLHNASFGGIAIHDKGIILECNQGLAEMTGYSYTELIGMDGFLLIAPEHREMVLNNIVAGYDKPYEALGMRKNGEIFYMRLEARNIPYRGKNVRAVEFRDISESKQAEEALRVSERMYRLLLSSSPQGIFILDMKRVITNISDITVEIFGAENINDFIGKNLFNFIPVNEVGKWNDILSRIITEGLIENEEVFLKRRNKSTFIGEISATLIQNNDGTPKAKMIIVRDISQKKVMEQQLFRSDRLASLGEMAAAMAHEINQPLLSIQFALENLVNKFRDINIADKKYLGEKLEKIFNDIDRISHLIQHVRAFSRDEEYINSSFSVNESINNAISMISQQFKHHGINLKIKLSDECPTIRGNTYRFEQVILNLLSNAKDAIEERIATYTTDFPKYVIISSYLSENSIFVEVKDNGCGIDENDIDRVLLPFYTTKETGKGTGLGLSISYSIVKELNGNIEIESKNRLGATFRIILPVNK